MRKLLILSLSILCMVITGCSTTKVERVPLDEQIDISGQWNDTDAQVVSKALISDCLSRSWLDNFLRSNGKNPVVIVGQVANQSHDHINTEVITKFLEREVLNSGKVTFVASPVERTQIRDEREDQQMGFTNPETIKQHGLEKGADFMLIGSINSIKDELKSKSVIMYQVNLELINLLTNEKVWIGQESLKKFVKRSRFSL